LLPRHYHDRRAKGKPLKRGRASGPAAIEVRLSARFGSWNLDRATMRLCSLPQSRSKAGSSGTPSRTSTRPCRHSAALLGCWCSQVSNPWAA
jgi:hypothetical protein